MKGDVLGPREPAKPAQADRRQSGNGNGMAVSDDSVDLSSRRAQRTKERSRGQVSLARRAHRAAEPRLHNPARAEQAATVQQRQNERRTWSRDPDELADHLPPLGYVVQRLQADDDVERRGFERQATRISTHHLPRPGEQPSRQVDRHGRRVDRRDVRAPVRECA